MRRIRTDPEVKKKASIKSREWQLRNPIQASWNNNRSSAKARGYVWELGREEHDALICADCSYCGEKPNPVNGIDRVDNDLGYIPSNIVTACEHCNYAKRRMTKLQFIELARRVVDHNRK